MTRCLAALALVASTASSARAHARPAALTTAHQRADGSLVLGATWGLAFRDAGEWSLGCAAAFAVDADEEDAQVALDGAGTIVLGTFDGLFESTDGCTFSQPAGPLPESWVVDVVTDPEGGVYAAATRVAAPDQLFHRTVDGPWESVGDPLDALVAQLLMDGSTLWRVLFLPRSAEGPPQVFLERSDDGVAFDRYEVALEGTEYSATLLAARDGEVHLVVRHFDGEAEPERVLRFDVTTETFEQVHAAAQLEVGAWTDDGLWVISRLEGLDLSPDGRTFERAHDVAGRCLVTIDGSLAACLDPARDPALLAHVTREAVAPIVHLADFDSLRACPAESDAALVCPAFREALAEDVEVPVDGVPPPGTSTGGGGCACAISTRERAPLTEGAFGLVLLLAQRRRRRTKASAAPMSAKP